MTVLFQLVALTSWPLPAAGFPVAGKATPGTWGGPNDQVNHVNFLFPKPEVNKKFAEWLTGD
jgi:hypothetical protein